MTDKVSGPDGASLADRLRACLRFDEPNPSESQLEQLAREAAAEIDRLRSTLFTLWESSRYAASDMEDDEYAAWQAAADVLAAKEAHP